MRSMRGKKRKVWEEPANFPSALSASLSPCWPGAAGVVVSLAVCGGVCEAPLGGHVGLLYS